MEDSRSVFKSISKTKHTYIHQEENNENKALNMNENEQQEYRKVGRKLYNNRKPTATRQDPRNASALKARKDQLAGEDQPIDPPAADQDKKPEEREKTEEEIKQELEEKENDIKKHEESYYYSPYYYDNKYEYRHVVLPKQLIKWIPRGVLLEEAVWRSLGIKQSKGWEHYMVYAPEPHILLFKREINYIQKYGNEDKKAVKHKE